jgi:hypothetical protein
MSPALALPVSDRLMPVTTLPAPARGERVALAL